MTTGEIKEMEAFADRIFPNWGQVEEYTSEGVCVFVIDYVDLITSIITKKHIYY